MADLLTNLAAAAGAASGDGTYIEDVFSTYLYTGTGSAQTITNGIDLDGEGGLVWIKSRSAATNHFLFDTERGVTDELNSNTTDAEASLANSLTAFNSDGFSISSATGIGVSAATYASWTFRKAPKFFDVVTYTGDGVSGRTISHNLGSTPGCIIVKCTSTIDSWAVYHRSITPGYYVLLNLTLAAVSNSDVFTTTAPTSSVFSVGNDSTTNLNGRTYVAYLFAHDAGGFGDDGLQNVVSCGSYLGNDGTQDINVGFEPQWVLIKNIDNPSNWALFDNMRSFIVDSSADSLSLRPNDTTIEGSATNARIGPRPNGFGFISEAGNDVNSVGGGYTYIYIAIRRGPMKTPTSGTEVLGLNARTGTGANATVTGGAGVTDLAIIKNRGSANWVWTPRLAGTGYLSSNQTTEETAAGTTILQANPWDVMDGVKVGTTSSLTNTSGNTFINYLLNRAPGFFDVVCDTGTGSAHTISHNLGVVPELMIRKKRSATDNWIVYAGDPTDYLILNSTAATADLDTMWDDTAPTASVFTVGTNDDVNQSTGTFVTYLFASLAGVSKVGTFTQVTPVNTQVNCGFSGGARFVLFKRTDNTSDWFLFDSARGIVAGNDPYLRPNLVNVEVTASDGLIPYLPGFETNGNWLSAGTYIYLAIS